MAVMMANMMAVIMAAEITAEMTMEHQKQQSNDGSRSVSSRAEVARTTAAKMISAATCSIEAAVRQQ